MPTYQYACTACDERLEVVQSFSDAALTECPACGGSLRKVFSAVGVVFKGSGFYKTDSRASNGAKAGAKAEGGKDAPAASGGSDASSSPATTSGDSAGKESGSKGSGNAAAAATGAPKVSTPASKSA